MSNLKRRCSFSCSAIVISGSVCLSFLVITGFLSAPDSLSFGFVVLRNSGNSSPNFDEFFLHIYLSTYLIISSSTFSNPQFQILSLIFSTIVACNLLCVLKTRVFSYVFLSETLV